MSDVISPAGVRLHPMADRHATQMLDIYRLGIATGNATFETVLIQRRSPTIT
jgi:L-amino acid N-acyltransferase YncA